ncbi:MOSC domain-containing protein [Shewanella sp. NIFS-20-20]|uniref:MOSC domain-containing protein n=1 Tax=Shewanella sp. NIFS-20-20 TaxID=2853806 RepID=UPI001C476A2D|nr:MOSC domain-containing protein [Shewanella sp. NIFS-20-20]MBV7315579.1 molybdenum cofactor biosysynthesis protein [Shewanella sp. NIFS-20-20]
MKLIGIAYKSKKSGPMMTLTRADVSLEHGVAQDVFGKPGKRQVTVMSQPQWQQACEQINMDLDWLCRRANLLIADYQFSPADMGKHILIGAEVKLLITGETDPCSKMEKQASGLLQALLPDWRGGVTCRVICAGQIHHNDAIQIV